MTRQDGSPFWARLEMTADGPTSATADAVGALVGRVVISDITARIRSEQERQQAAAALRLSEARYRAVAEENTLLLNEVNHRVKNNLAAMVGLLQLELRYLAA